MARYILTIILFCSTCAIGGEVRWSNRLAPKGDKAQAVTLAQSGQAKYVILLSGQPTTVERKAAEDLRYWLGVISGADFRVIQEGQKNTTYGNYISIGDTKALAESGLEKDFPVPGDNGYAIAEKKGNLFLWGTRMRGVINAVYALLEEDIGCRWYTRNVTRIPRRDTLTVKLVPRSYTPALKQRVPLYKDAFDLTWALRNRTSNPAMPEEWGGSFNLPHGVHTLGRLLPPGKYFKEHPEYYSEKEGIRSPTQPCLTNRDAMKIVAENLKKVIRENPDKKIFSVSLNDGTGYCCCTNCLAVDKQNGMDPKHPGRNRAGSLIYFVNGVAEIVEKEFPDVLISTLAYLGTAEAPPHIRPRKNVAIRICDDIHSWPMPLIDFVSSDQPESQTFRTLMTNWSNICNNIYIWEYTTTYNHYPCPLGNMNRIEPMVDFYIKHGVKGIMFQGDYSSYGGSRVPLRCWVLAKHLWNPEWNVSDLMQDFATGMYGRAAGEIIEYYKMLDQMGLEYQSGKKPLSEMRKHSFSDPTGYDWKFTRKALKLFKAAEAKADTPAVFGRIQLEKLPVLYLIASNQYENFSQEQVLAYIDELERLCKQNQVTSFCEGVNGIDARFAYFRAKAKFDSRGLAWIKLPETYRFKAVTKSDALSEKQCIGREIDDSKWKIISGWKEWDFQGYPGFSGTGWYRQKFRIPSDWPKDAGLYLLVGGIDEQGIIYVNGKKKYEHTTGAQGMSLSGLYKTKLVFPVDTIDRDGENQLTVEVMNRVGAGGLFKPIYLVSAPAKPEAESLWDYIVSAESDMNKGN